MLFIRSLIFNVVFYFHMFLWLIVCVIALPFPKAMTRYAMVTWAHQVPYLLKWIAGIEIEVRGLENIPEGKVIVACNHQSFLEIILLAKYLKFPLMMFKVSLGRIPAFGWSLYKLRFIPIVRGGRAKTIKFIVQASKSRILDNGQVMIFPEGTRVSPGQVLKLKQGVIAIYEALHLDCMPVAQNAGLFWARNSFYRYPGKVVIEFMPVIQKDLEREDFTEQLHSAMMTKKLALELEAFNAPNPPPAPETAKWLEQDKHKLFTVKNGEVTCE
ncbi:MAG: 1-acyl-sn-glycerol-3-phosphate acyltransferase [Rhizobiales bacterium]|nr:1-acyl-sn-glycerol-3-phosphate acyltransferase [Hyphomicrobiales bacterium]